ncbi:BrnA antitoxin family protein [Flavimaricola marinus]|uniref:BrnA antitoxin of type II toxin-antitoxin system n=1 Tax=Flavimaricola marinus TaxID=1819565 RepID=A0A238L8J6_9RHOB|nr:BrnA antitoxin family protein [Flavimaricola marinus]SMY05903.1 hypothetical protein LOM8899_00024 [Flavimaricola marinus]
MTKSLTKTERIARERLFRHLWEDRKDSLSEELRERVPDAWHTLERDLDVEEEKVKVTLYLDTSVAKFYRAMGKGYQPRINRILATWAQLKIGGFLESDRKFRERMRSVMGKE